MRGFTGKLMREMIELSRKDGELGFSCLDTSGFNEMVLPPASSVSQSPRRHVSVVRI